MKNLDFELGRKLHGFVDGIATDTGNSTDTVYSRLSELLASTTNGTADTPKPKRRSPHFHVVGSKVHPQHKEIVKLSKQGLSGDAIATKLGISRHYVFAARAQAGLNKASNQHTDRSDSKLDRIKALAQEGFDQQEIAQQLGITPSGVSWYTRNYGIEVKKRKRFTNPWAGMGVEERRAEMKRRRELAASKKSAKTVTESQQ